MEQDNTMESIDDLVKRVAQEMGALPCPCCGAAPMALRMTAVFPPDEDTARLGSAIACSNEACRLLAGFQWEMEDEQPDEQPGAMDRALEAWNQRSVEQALRVLVSAMRARGACQDRSMCLTIDDGCVAIGIQGMPRLAGFEQVSRWLEGTKEAGEPVEYVEDDAAPIGKPEFTGPALEALERIKAGPSIHELFKKLMLPELLDDSDDHRYVFVGTVPVGTGQTNAGGDYYATDATAPVAGEAAFTASSVDAPQMWVDPDAVARVHVVPARPPALTFASPEDEARWKAAQETHVAMLLKMSGERT